MISTADERAFLTARNLREDLQVSEKLRVDIESVIRNLNISLKRADLGPGVLGGCKTVGLKRLIIIRPDFKSIEQERFTIAHELGHILIHHVSHYCRNENFNMWRSTNDKENEANAFAAEMFLPRRTMLEILSKKDISIPIIKDVAKTYGTSLSATVLMLISIVWQQTDTAVQELMTLLATIKG